MKTFSSILDVMGTSSELVYQGMRENTKNAAPLLKPHGNRLSNALKLCCRVRLPVEQDAQWILSQKQRASRYDVNDVLEISA